MTTRFETIIDLRTPATRSLRSGLLPQPVSRSSAPARRRLVAALRTMLQLLVLSVAVAGLVRVVGGAPARRATCAVVSASAVDGGHAAFSAPARGVGTWSRAQDVPIGYARSATSTIWSTPACAAHQS